MVSWVLAVLPRLCLFDKQSFNTLIQSIMALFVINKPLTFFFPLKRMSNRRCNADGRLRAKLYPFRETASEKATGAFPSWARRNQKRIVCRIRHSFFYLGRITESMMWMTPFLHSMSAVVTVASLILTPAEASILTMAPLTVAASLSLTTSPDITLPATTW